LTSCFGRPTTARKDAAAPPLRPTLTVADPRSTTTARGGASSSRLARLARVRVSSAVVASSSRLVRGDVGALGPLRDVAHEDEAQERARVVLEVPADARLPLGDGVAGALVVVDRQRPGPHLEEDDREGPRVRLGRRALARQ